MAYSVGSVNGLLTKTGIGGLASGMDIDSLIEKMTSISRQRITKEEQSVQKLLWKQDAYRSVSKSLIEFRSKYLNVTSPTNFKSASLFNTVKASVGSGVNAFTATATGAASAGKMYVNSIEQLASSTKITNNTSVSKPLEANMDITGAIDALQEIENDPSKMRSFIVDLDGQSRLIVLDKDFADDLRAQPGNINEQFEKSLQKLLNLNFNGTASPPAGSERINVSVDSSGKITMNTLPSSRITIKSTGEDPEHAETLRLLGFSDGQSSKINTSRSIADLADKLGGGTLAPDASGKYRFSINGKSFEFDQSQSVDDMILAVNNSTAGVTLSYSEISDKFSLISNTYGASNIVAGDIGGNLLSTIFSASNSDTTNGTNAVAYINGSRVERNSNDFTIDGVHISLKSTLNAGGTLPPAPESGEAITLSPNSDKLFDAVKQFVEDYNSMMTFMRGLPKEKVYSSYEPLTDAQRAEMSEGQIKQWEEKAKSGILSGDSLINGLSTSIQGALLNTIGTNGFGLYSLGIKSAGWAENGKLELDEDALRSALDNNPDEVRALFTEAEKGISLKLDKIIDDAVRTTGVKGRRGSLIEMAGYAATNSDKENGLTRQIEDYTKSIDRFKAQLEKEESRLWSRFSMMESALERLNYQGGLLSQYLGNGQQ